MILLLLTACLVACAQEAHAAKLGKDPARLLCADTTPQELFRKAGRYHSRLQNIEEECWVYKGQLPDGLLAGEDHRDAYYWRKAFHPLTLEELPM